MGDASSSGYTPDDRQTAAQATVTPASCKQLAAAAFTNPLNGADFESLVKVTPSWQVAPDVDIAQRASRGACAGISLSGQEGGCTT